MSQSSEFADHFARLTAALVRQGDDVDEQQQYLLSAVAAARYFPVKLARVNDVLFADGTPVARSTIYTMVFVDRLKEHGIIRLEVSQSPNAGDVHILARLLARPAQGTGNVREQLVALGAASVSVALDDLAVGQARSSAPQGSFEKFELVSEEQMQSSIARPAVPAPPAARAATTETSGPMAGVSINHLLKSLELAEDLGAVENILNAIFPHIVSAVDAGKMDDAIAATRALARREARATDPRIAKLIGHAIRRLLTSKLIAAVMKQLPGAGDAIPEFALVLAHGGDGALETLVDRLVESEQAKERRAIIAVLVQLKTGVPFFIHMLGDKRWFVVRNAADLLAQVGAPEAEEPLVQALHNEDSRARRSVVAALGRYPTPKSQGCVRRALRDQTSDVRLAAAGGIGRSKSTEMTAAVIEAFKAEQDEQVRIALLGGLGRLATEDAVKQLADAAAPELLLKRKTSAFRVAAVRALREAGTGAAVQALRGLSADKDPAVRDVASKPLARS